MKKNSTTKKRKSSSSTVLSPLLNSTTKVDWWFLFKFNSAEEPGDPKPKGKKGIFDVPGWKRPAYEADGKKFSQKFAYASSQNGTLQIDHGVIGTSKNDPLGATFAQVYQGDPESTFYILWNDQFYGDPINDRNKPWGHSKGMLTWDADGNGFVMQVSTPSWPGAGNKKFPRRTDGNTLGYVTDDDIEVSQHFFAQKLNADDVKTVIRAMINAKVAVAPKTRQAFNIGGPADITELAAALGKTPAEPTCTIEKLSSGVQVISKPATMAVPPWQLVSAKLNSIDLRVATWWAYPKIYSTTRSTKMLCWEKSLEQPGAIDIATTGVWDDGKETFSLGLQGGLGRNKNHAKFGVSTSGRRKLSIFGDMNQQGALAKGYATARQTCESSQNGRGGLFFVVEDKTLHASLTQLLTGESAPKEAPPKKKKKVMKKKTSAKKTSAKKAVARQASAAKKAAKRGTKKKKRTS